jgi:hypothetical protein
MEDYSNFKDYPRSLTEVKADKSQDSKDWTPRDVMIDALRKIDNGEWSCDALVIIYRDYGENRTTFSCSTPGGLIEAIGMLSRAEYQMHEACKADEDVD